MLNREDDFEKENHKKLKNSNINSLDNINDYKNIVEIVKNESNNNLIYNERMK